jgi:hypothetical protein
MKTVCSHPKILNLKTKFLNNFHTFEPQQNKTMASILLGNQYTYFRRTTKVGTILDF